MLIVVWANLDNPLQLMIMVFECSTKIISQEPAEIAVPEAPAAGPIIIDIEHCVSNHSNSFDGYKLGILSQS